MKEIADIVHAYNKAQGAGQRSVLATVVKVMGSSYRRPGARMLIAEDGRLTGAISGGCLEGDARRKALFALEKGQNRVVTYDSTDEDSELFGIQLGCNGIVHILFEPIIGENHPFALLERTVMQDMPSCLVTLFDPVDAYALHPGTCLLVRRDAVANVNLDAASAKSLAMEAHHVLQKLGSCVRPFTMQGFTYDALFDYIPPSVSLVIAGAGNDAMPLTRMACELGWNVTVIDGRPAYATAQRFPGARALHIVKAGENLPEATAYILMSHNYPYDLAMLRQLIHKPCAYIGILGPKTKREQMLKDLRATMNITGRDLHKLFGPAGLDIGTETAEEIALSIVAEIKAVLAQENAGFLREKTDFIHPRATA